MISCDKRADLDAVGKSGSSGQELPAAPAADRYLAQLIEKAVLSVPDVDANAYKAFCAKMSKLMPQLPDLPLSSGDLALIREILREFGLYHKCADTAVRERISGWRELVAKLLLELFSGMGVDPASADAAPLVQSVATLLTGAEIHGFLTLLSDFLRLKSLEGQAAKALPRKEAARPASNHNAAGLRGPAAAIDHLRSILNAGGLGFIVVFRLSCLDSINERYGEEAMQDCMMAASAFLIRNLRSDDSIYYWNEESLLAILQSPAPEKAITVVIQRIIDNNRDITIQIGAHVVMLRVPLIFELTPISQLRTAEDLYNLSPQKKCKQQIGKANKTKTKNKAPE
jgi:GGDEF domain-containing protein